MAEQHNCAQCRHLTRTSPEQVFLLCAFWANPDNGIRGDYDWVVGHCHVQPEAPACMAFQPIERRREHGETHTWPVRIESGRLRLSA